MYIEPNSDFIVLKKCPLDNTYTHTIWFPDKDAQYDYFYSLKKYEYKEQSYQRYKRGTMRVEVSADKLYDCNYLMFKNTAYGDKWFYAFILSIEYINNACTEITYQIDVIQTWYFDYEFTGCYVEREHTETDVIGDNTYPENFETGEYIISTQSDLSALSTMDIVVCATVGYTVDGDGNSVLGNVRGGMYGGIFSGVAYHRFPNTINGAKDCADFLLEITEAGKSEGIVSVFLMPSIFAYNVGDVTTDTMKSYEVTLHRMYSNIDGYVPHNKKLFTYPYNVFVVTNNMGTACEYRYEDFFNTDKDDEGNLLMKFKLIGDMSQNPSVYLVPKNYKIRQTTDTSNEIIDKTYNFEEKATLTGFPLLPSNVDMFKAWEAQNLNAWNLQNTANIWQTVGSSATQIIGGAVSGSSSPWGGVGSSGKGALAGASVGALNSGFNFINTYNHIQVRNAEINAKALTPPQAKNVGSSTTLCAFDKMKFELYFKQIKREYAVLIDQFWDMFGYPVHKIKVPNTNVRPYWTYTKTLYCNIKSNSMPTDDVSAICDIFNKGITFWNDGTKVGQYGLDNSV